MTSPPQSDSPYLPEGLSAINQYLFNVQNQKLKNMKRILEFVEKYFFIIILLAVAISLVYPNSFKWVLSEYNGINIINLLLSIVLFTMGTTLKVDDFINVFKNPKAITVGI